MKKLILILLLIQSILATAVFAKTNNQKQFNAFESIDVNNLNLHDVYLFRKEVINFYNTIDKKNKYDEIKTVDLQRLLNHLINQAYASDGDVCLFAGYPSQIINNICKNPATHGVIKNYGKVQSTPYESCPSSSAFRCSPLLFGTGSNGKGKCIETGGTYEGLTQKCHEQTGDQIESAVTNLLNDNEAISTIVADINSFCQKYENDETKPSSYDHKVTCHALRARFDKMGHEIKKRNEQAGSKAKEVSKNANKALGIMKKCQDEYDKENDGFIGSIVGSKRGILNTLTSGATTCRDLVENIDDKEFKEIKKTFDDIENKVVQSDILSRTTQIGVEASVKNLMLTMLQFDPNFNLETLKKNVAKKAPMLMKKPYSDIVKKSAKELKAAQKANKVNKFTSAEGQEEMLDKFGELSSSINQLCSNIRYQYEGVEDKGTVMNSDEENAFYAEMQAEIDNTVMSFQTDAAQDGNTQFSRLFATKHFREKLFPFSGSMAEKCAEDDLKSPFAFLPPKRKDILKAVSDYKEMMLDDLENLGEKTEALADGDQDDIQDEIQDLLKYKPYLAAQFMTEKQGNEQVAYAKYMCKQTLDIYNSDENFRVFELGLGAASFALSAVAMASGIGSPLAPVLATAGAGLMVAEGAVAYADIQDARSIKKGLAVGYGTNQLDARAYSKGLNAAEEQELYAKAALAMAALQPVAAASKTIAKGARALSRARKVSKANKIDLKAVKKADKIIAKADKKAARINKRADNVKITGSAQRQANARAKVERLRADAVKTQRTAKVKAYKVKRAAAQKSNKLRRKVVDSAVKRQEKLVKQADDVMASAAKKAEKIRQAADVKAQKAIDAGDVSRGLAMRQKAVAKADDVTAAAQKQVGKILDESDADLIASVKSLKKKSTKIRAKADKKATALKDTAKKKADKVLKTAKNKANENLLEAQRRARVLPSDTGKRLVQNTREASKKLVRDAQAKAATITKTANDKALTLTRDASSKADFLDANVRKVLGIKKARNVKKTPDQLRAIRENRNAMRTLQESHQIAESTSRSLARSADAPIKPGKTPAVVKPKAPKPNISKEEIIKNSKLTNFQRKKTIRRLYPELTDLERLAIYQAHKKIPCPVFGCTKSQLKAKMKHMKAAGVPDDIARDSIRRGITGHAPGTTGKINYITPQRVEIDDIVGVQRSNGELSLARVTDIIGGKATVDVYENGVWIGTKNNVDISKIKVPENLKKNFNTGETVQVRRSSGTFTRAQVTGKNPDGTYNVNIHENGQIYTKSNVKPENVKLEGFRRTDTPQATKQAQPKPIESKPAQLHARVRKENPYNQDYKLPEDFHIYEDLFEDGMKKVAKHEDPLAARAPIDTYRHKGYWRQHAASAQRIDELPVQGWKFHVSPKPEYAANLAQELLPELQKRGIMHKYVGNLRDYASKVGRIQDGDQGKFITIYPRNDDEAKAIGRLVSAIIQKNGYNQRHFLNVPNQPEFSPGIFGRYGRLKSGNLKDRNGVEIQGTGDHIYAPNGQIIRDPRGVEVPDFIFNFSF